MPVIPGTEEFFQLPLPERIAIEAESWVGTPFRHQGRIKGRAVDCAHFVALVAIGAGLTGIEIPHNYRPQEDGAVMLQLLDKYLVGVRTVDRSRGHILVFCDDLRRDVDTPRHLVIVSEITKATTYIINATEQGVRRHRIDSRWEKRLHSTWQAHE